MRFHDARPTPLPGIRIDGALRAPLLIAALLAWYPNTRLRVVAIVAPILTFLQLVLAGVGKWAGGLHVLNAILILGMYGWLTYRLRHEQPGG